MSEQETPFEWLPELEKELLLHDSVPMLGGAPQFPWETFISDLCQSFSLDNLEIIPTDCEWRTEKELCSGLSEQVHVSKVSITTIDSAVFWVMSEQDRRRLAHAVLYQDYSNVGLEDESLFSGFWHFAVAKVLDWTESNYLTGQLSPQLSSESELPEGPALCMDVCIRYMGKKMWGRLIIPAEFRQSWANHFEPRRPQNLTKEVGKNIPLELTLEGGSVSLSQEDWNNIQLGDFLLLDSCDIDPETKKGRITISINSKPVFRAKLRKSGNVKILDYAQ